MGNVGSSSLPARKSGEAHGSGSVTPGQAVTFDKKTDLILQHNSSSQEDDGPYYTTRSTNDSRRGSTDITQIPASSIFPRPRSNTISEGTTPSRRKSSAGETDTAGASGGTGSSIGNVNDEGKTTLPTVFKWDGGGKQVYISGTFSGWRAMPMVKSHGDFVTIIDLPEGDHQYKFMVDGEWKHDPKLKNIDNDAGTKNNLVSVNQSDFEVFQALAKDSEDATNDAQKEYSQDIPESKPWEKISGPPVLPPHLLQVILNKDTPLSCEPTLLPEPNHVMLNHLYALSIKDGVMVLSATHRYRKKYVTTLLYKPI